MKRSLNDYSRLFVDLRNELFRVMDAHYQVCEQGEFDRFQAIDVALSGVQSIAAVQIFLGVAARDFENPKRAKREAAQLCDALTIRIREEVMELLTKSAE